MITLAGRLSSASARRTSSSACWPGPMVLRAATRAGRVALSPVTATLSAGETPAGDEDLLAVTGDKAIWTARVAARSTIGPGQQAELAVDTSGLQFFDPESGLSIGHSALLNVP